MKFTPEQKAAWRAGQKAWANHLVWYWTSDKYKPPGKAPSRRDRHRMEVQQRKDSHPNQRASNYEKPKKSKSMNINQMRESNYLKKEDVGTGVLATIKGVIQQNVAMQGQPEDLKWCLELVEADKPMILNTTNCEMIAKVLGSPETDDWTGKKIVLYSDPNVAYAGKLVGGIRVRAPRIKGAAPAPAPAPAAGGFRTKPQNQSPPPAPPMPTDAGIDAGPDDPGDDVPF